MNANWTQTTVMLRLSVLTHEEDFNATAGQVLPGMGSLAQVRENSLLRQHYAAINES